MKPSPAFVTLAPCYQDEGHSMLTSREATEKEPLPPKMDFGLGGKVPAIGWFLLVVMAMVEDCKMLQWEKAIFCHSKGTPGSQAFRHRDVNMLF